MPASLARGHSKCSNSICMGWSLAKRLAKQLALQRVIPCSCSVFKLADSNIMTSCIVVCNRAPSDVRSHMSTSQVWLANTFCQTCGDALVPCSHCLWLLGFDFWSPQMVPEAGSNCRPWGRFACALPRSSKAGRTWGNPVRVMSRASWKALADHPCTVRVRWSCTAELRTCDMERNASRRYLAIVWSRLEGMFPAVPMTT